MTKLYYNPKTDPNRSHISWKAFFVQMEAGLMKVVRCLNIEVGLMTVISAYVGLWYD